MIKSPVQKKVFIKELNEEFIIELSNEEIKSDLNGTFIDFSIYSNTNKWSQKLNGNIELPIEDNKYIKAVNDIVLDYINTVKKVAKINDVSNVAYEKFSILKDLH